MAEIDKAFAEGEQSEELTKILKEMGSVYVPSLYVSPKINQKKWQNPLLIFGTIAILPKFLSQFL